MDIKILIATHKKYWMPNDDVYIPIQVGKSINSDLGYNGDNTGINISIKNPYYCELTALYWAWKNLSADYIGLVHYRRYFTHHDYRNIKKKRDDIFSRGDFEKILKNVDIIVPKKRKYYIETNRSHYNHAHYKNDLDETEKVIQMLYPEWIDAFHEVMNRTSAHMFNMFVMKKAYFDEYVSWMFSILAELENRINISQYNSTEARVFGYISELLLDVWLCKKNIYYQESSVTFMEPQNWIIKGSAFLKRKIIPRSS